MNQATNLIQWKNLDEDQREQFDFYHGVYEAQFPGNSKGWRDCSKQQSRESVVKCHGDTIYRLKILPDEWYNIDYDIEYGGNEISLGCNINGGKDNYKSLSIRVIRPAVPHEIPKPKPKPTLLERIEEKWGDKRVIMLYWMNDYLYLKRTPQEFGHIHAQSMKGFEGYVYDYHGLERMIKATRVDPEGISTPVAVLFNK